MGRASGLTDGGHGQLERAASGAYATAEGGGEWMNSGTYMWRPGCAFAFWSFGVRRLCRIVDDCVDVCAGPVPRFFQ